MFFFARSAKFFFESRKIGIFKPLKNHKGGWTRFKGGRIYTHPGHFLRGGAPPPPDPTRGGGSGILDLGEGEHTPPLTPPMPTYDYIIFLMNFQQNTIAFWL